MKEGITKHGITLIALVISIIILFILAGFTIVELNKSNLFNNINEAKKKYTNSQKEENVILDDFSNQIDNYQLADNTRSYVSKEEYEKMKKELVAIDPDSIQTLLTGGYSYTFTKDYRYAFVYYGTNRWAGTSYYTNGLDKPIYTQGTYRHYFGIMFYIYKNVKEGDSINLGGSADRALSIWAIE